MKDFKLFIKDYDLDYQLKGEKEYLIFLEKIKKSPISINRYSKNIYSNKNGSHDFLDEDMMTNYFEQIKKVQFLLDENQLWIKNGLEREISKVLGGEKERIRASLNEDIEYKKAVELILDLKVYYTILDF